MVAQGILVRAADAGFGRVAAAFEARGRVVLDDVVLPVGEPDRAVGPDLGEDGRHPFVAARDQIEIVVGRVAGAVASYVEERDVLHRRLADHGPALQAGGKIVGEDERAAGRRGVAAEDVHLPVVRRDRVGLVLGVDPLGGHRAQAAGQDGGGDAAEEDRCVVRGAAELVAEFIHAVAPGVVRELVQELEGGAVGLEAERALREPHFLSADGAIEARIPHRAVEPVVQAVVQIVRLRMRVVDAPAGHDLAALVGAVVAIGVAEEEKAGRLRDHDAALGEHEAGGDVQLLGEDRELVGATVAVGVFADLDAVVAQAVGLHGVRVVAGFGYPEPAAFVPGHEDRLGDVGIAGEELKPEIGCNLRALEAALDVQRMLEGDGLRTLLVVRDRRAGFAALRFALGEKLLVSGDALDADGAEEFRLRGGGKGFGRGITE